MSQNPSYDPTGPNGTLVKLPIRVPIGPHTYYNEVLARVTIRLVQIDARKNPGRYKIPYRGVYELMDQMRRDPHTLYTGYPYMISLAKYMLSGGTMASWLLWCSTQNWDTMRSIHKRAFTTRRP